MGYLGKVSGRDEDKISKVGFHVVKPMRNSRLLRKVKWFLYVKTYGNAVESRRIY